MRQSVVVEHCDHGIGIEILTLQPFRGGVEQGGSQMMLLFRIGKFFVYDDQGIAAGEFRDCGNFAVVVIGNRVVGVYFVFSEQPLYFNAGGGRAVDVIDLFVARGGGGGIGRIGDFAVSSA